MKILIDEMDDGMDERLIQLGYDAYSVKKLQIEGKNLCGYTYTKTKKLYQIMEKSSKNIVNNRYSEMKKGSKKCDLIVIIH